MILVKNINIDDLYIPGIKWTRKTYAVILESFPTELIYFTAS